MAGEVHPLHARRHADPGASATVTLEEIAASRPRQNPTSGAPDRVRCTRPVAGDTLPSVGEREYGDPTLWRVIAEANEIDDPMRLGSAARCWSRAAEEIGGECEMPGQQYTNHLRRRDRRQAAARRRARAAVVQAYVDDSRDRARTCSCCASATRTGVVLAKTGITIGATVKISVAAPDGSEPPLPLVTGEVTALEAELDATGTFTVDPRARHVAPAAVAAGRRETYRQMTASRRGAEGRRGGPG